MTKRIQGRNAPDTKYKGLVQFLVELVKFERGLLQAQMSSVKVPSAEGFCMLSYGVPLSPNLGCSVKPSPNGHLPET